MLVNDPPVFGQSFRRLPLAGDADVDEVSSRACEKFGWGAAVTLYLVPDRERARTIERNPSSAADIFRGDPLFADDLIVMGSWLLARVPPPPAEAPGALRRLRVAVLAASFYPPPPPPIQPA